MKAATAEINYTQILEQMNADLLDDKARLLDELDPPPVKVMLNDPRSRMPSRKSNGDAGYDLYCIERVEIPSGQKANLPTGVCMQIPHGWYGRVAPRSGLADRHGINVHAGVIDSTYTGPVSVCLINHGHDLVEFRPGDRIAQIIIERCHTGEMILTDYLEPTDRGAQGFGSSGR